MRKTMMLISLVFGVFCFQAIADREVNAIVPIRAFDNADLDSNILLFLSNPSTVRQTVKLTLKANGEFYFSNQSYNGTAWIYIDGSNNWTCSPALNRSDASVKTCSMNSAIESMAPGESRTLAIRVRRSSGSSTYPANIGVNVTIKVLGDQGHILAAGSFQQENANGIAYIGGPFTINGGRPF